MIFFTHQPQELYGILPIDRWKMLQEGIERVAGRNVVEKRLGHYTGIAEDQRASQHTRIRVNRTVIECDHTH